MSPQILLASVGAAVILGGAVVASQQGQTIPSPSSSSTLAQNDGSSATAMGLATYLKTTGAKMYGAFWCGHCAHQKEIFGSAFSQINYIECDPKGKNPQPDLCQKVGIQGYPTWEIKGKFYPGVQSLQNLAALSGYKQ